MSSIEKGGKTHVRHEQIELRAYEIYLQRGGADGTEVEDWLVAERELLEEQDRPEIPESSSVPWSARRAMERATTTDAEDARTVRARGKSASAGDRSSS